MAPAISTRLISAVAFAGILCSNAQAEIHVPLHVTRSSIQTDPRLHRAYAQLQKGDLDQAAALYAGILRQAPKQVDALLGQAVIAQRRGQPTEAEAWYRRAIDADPANPDAHAGLIGLGGNADAAAAESALHELLARHPDAGALHFALGNLHAVQQRWPEARQAYLRAHGADSTNPDYLYNLASALDHLHQPAQAASRYRAALAARALRPGSFDPMRVEERIRQLARGQPSP